MKVELSKIRLGIKALTETVCAGIPSNDNKSFEHDIDVTNDFIKCIIDWCAGYKRTIVGGGKKYEITVKEIK